MLSLNVTKQHTIVLRGRSRIVSYCIQVRRGDEEWNVFQTEEQISNLSASLLQPSIEGHLYKKATSSIVGKWNKRYFKFVGSTLYYSNETNPGFDIVGTSYKKIEIYDARIIPTNDIQAHMGSNIPADFNNSMKGLFEIHKKDKQVIYLKAPSNGEMIKWVEALRVESEEHRRTRSAPAVTHRTASPQTLSPLRSQPSSPQTLSRHTKRESSGDLRTTNSILNKDAKLSSSSPQLFRPRLTKKESSKDFRSLQTVSEEENDIQSSSLSSSLSSLSSLSSFSPSTPPLSPIIVSPASTPSPLSSSPPLSPPLSSPGSSPLSRKESSPDLRGLKSSKSSEIESETNFKLFRVNALLQSLCAAHPDSDILRSFLLVNAFPNEEFPQMRMMLDALKENNLTLIENLHEQYGVALNFVYKGSSLFVEACRSGSIPIVKYILTTEPETSVEELIYKKDNFDSTPLHYACISSLPLACMLFAIGSVEKFVSGFGPWTPLHHLAQHTKAIIKEQIDYLEKLISSMPHLINAQDLAGRTPLHICAKQSNLAMAQLLLNKGAELDRVTIQRKSFLHLLAHNASTKSHDMMAQILQHLFKSAITLDECEKQLTLLELQDQELKTAIQYAYEKHDRSPHTKYLTQHYTELENFKFSLLFTEILYQCGHKTMTEIKTTKSYIALIGFLCSACNSNDYHSDVHFLIHRALELRIRCESSLLDLNITDEDRLEFMEEVNKEIYPFVHSLFMRKKFSIDSILTRCLKVYNKNVTYAGFGITDSFWNKVKEKAKVIESQRGGFRKSVNVSLEEQILVKRALEILAEIPKLVNPRDKLQCLREIFDMFDCLGADEEFSLLAYLMVKAANLDIQWSAEIDYILTLTPTENCMILKGLQMFFLTSWMQMKNGIFQVEEVTTTESLTIIDVKCLWDTIKETSSGQLDISLLHGLFFECAHNTSGTNFVTIEGCFSPSFLSNHHMQSILERLQMTLVATDHGTTEVAYGEFLDRSLFGKIGCAFYGMLEGKG